MCFGFGCRHPGRAPMCGKSTTHFSKSIICRHFFKIDIIARYNCSCAPNAANTMDIQFSFRFIKNSSNDTKQIHNPPDTMGNTTIGYRESMATYTIVAFLHLVPTPIQDILPPRHSCLRGKNTPLVCISVRPYYTIVNATLTDFSSNVMLDNATYSKAFSSCSKRCG